MDDKELKLAEATADENLQKMPADLNMAATEPLPDFHPEEIPVQMPELVSTPVIEEEVAEMPVDDAVAEDFSFADISDYAAEEAPAEEKPVEEKKPGTILSYLHDLVFGLVIILLVFMLVFRGVVVSGPSMKDTFMDGDYIILLSNVFYRNPKQGDIIVASKDSFRNGEPIIKRVIATEGQKVTIDFEAGIVYVDGKPLDEPYTKTPTNLYEGLVFEEYVVAEGCVFVMGDNRNDSKDSRSPEIGLIDCREIMGKALFLVLPGTDGGFEKRDFSRIGALW